MGKVDAKASVMIAPDADHVKISIWPGVSTKIYFGCGFRFFSQICITYTSAHQLMKVLSNEDLIPLGAWLQGTVTDTDVIAFTGRGRCSLAWSKRVAKRFRDVRMPPLGPREYCFMTFL